MNIKESTENQKMKKVTPPSFIKLAMRNMVKKGRQSIFHFGLTAIGFIIFILIIAFLGRPTLPH
ncbi:DUF3285 domain-containing protein [Prochlorococcus sp. MIT 1341]|uniref:DUF3285 domain-containing protein n=1 Tax=Prochlorococcus sp. MIT 1341 TaxID=3096221 RepID=UPI002A7603A5|nr:DUF3285 domain-containing protein [Prochlorococcus sp. MIT 1341]